MQQKPMDSLGGTSNSDMQFDGTQKEKEQGRQNKICEELVTGLDSTERTGGEADGSDRSWPFRFEGIVHVNLLFLLKLTY